MKGTHLLRLIHMRKAGVVRRLAALSGDVFDLLVGAVGEVARVSGGHFALDWNCDVIGFG